MQTKLGESAFFASPPGYHKKSNKENKAILQTSFFFSSASRRQIKATDYKLCIKSAKATDLGQKLLKKDWKGVPTVVPWVKDPLVFL